MSAIETLKRVVFQKKWLRPPQFIIFGLIFIIFFITSFITLNPDFGWHLVSGQYYLAHGIPAHDIFTYTAANFPWINHEWLSDIIQAILYSVGGYTLLSLFYAGLWTLAFWLVGRKSLVLTLALAVLATLPFAGVRTTAWSVLGLAILYTILKLKDRRYQMAIPLVLLLWANVHGSFVIGLFYLGYCCLKQKSWRLAGITVVSALVTLVNPYGINLYVELFRTITDTSLKSNISEWASFNIPPLTWLFVVLWLAAFLVTDVKKWRKYLGFDVILFVLGVSSIRNLVIFIIMAVGSTDKRLRMMKLPKKIKNWQRIVAAACLFLIVGVGSAIIYNEYDGTQLDREYNYPTKEVAYLKQNPCQGNLFNDYNFGGYLIWKLPSQKVYIDGRMPSWSIGSTNFMQDYNKVISDAKFRKQQFKKYNIRCVMLTNNGMMLMLQFEGWKVVANDEGAGSYLLVNY